MPNPTNNTLHSLAAQGAIPATIQTKVDTAMKVFEQIGRAKGFWMWQTLRTVTRDSCVYCRMILKKGTTFAEKNRACTRCVTGRRSCLVSRQGDNETIAVLLPLPASYRRTLKKPFQVSSLMLASPEMLQPPAAAMLKPDPCHT